MPRTRNVRFSAAQDEVLERQARQHGLPVSAWIRLCLIEALHLPTDITNPPVEGERVAIADVTGAPDA